MSSEYVGNGGRHATGPTVTATTAPAESVAEEPNALSMPTNGRTATPHAPNAAANLDDPNKSGRRPPPRRLQPKEEHIWDIFCKIDTDGSGTLDKVEVSMRSLFIQIFPGGLHFYLRWRGAAASTEYV